MTGHLLGVLAALVALGSASVALVAAFGVAWGLACVSVLWTVVAVLLVDVEALQR